MDVNLKKDNFVYFENDCLVPLNEINGIDDEELEDYKN